MNVWYSLADRHGTTTIQYTKFFFKHFNRLPFDESFPAEPLKGYGRGRNTREHWSFVRIWNLERKLSFPTENVL